MSKHTLKATVLRTDYLWSVELSSPNPLVVEAARKGLQEWLQDATANPDFTDEELKHPAMLGQDPPEGMTAVEHRKTKAYKDYLAFVRPIKLRTVQRRLDKIVNGTYQPGHGGGNSMTSTDTAWIAWLNSKGRREDSKEIIRKTLHRAQESMCREFLLQEFDAGTDERKDVENNIGKHLAERFEAWKSDTEQNDPLLKMGLDYHKAMKEAESVSVA